MLDLLSDLNEPQRRAVTHVDGPLLVLAGAGSGKTRVITRRCAYLISRGVAPRNVLAITFTNKTAGEMRDRIDALGTPAGLTVGTFHALCARLLREFADEANLSRNYSIYDRQDQLRAVKEAMGRANLPEGRFLPAAVHAAISNAKNDLCTPDEYENHAADFYRRHVANVYREYEKLLAANNALDFDDLLLRVARLLRARVDIRDELSRRYRYVLIDEYQDTNRAQYIIAHGIALSHGNICATGDPDQSIYAWRGADIGNILEFETDYPEATVIRLEENYRSTQPILSAAARLISCNVQRKDKALWTRRKGGAAVRVVRCDDERAEASLLAQRLLKYSAADSLDDVAVFYRVNSLSRVVEETLLGAGIAYRIARGVEFYNRKEIKDTLAYLRLLVNPADDLSCVRIINTPTRGIGARTVAKLSALAAERGISLLEACGHGCDASLAPAAAGKAKAFAELIAAMAADLARPVSGIVEDVVRLSGLERLRDGDEDARQAYANIGELVSTAREFDGRTDAGTLEEYLNLVSLASDADHYEGAAGGAVTLMTLHAAKGLEFSAVFVIGCEEGLLPFRRGNGRQDDSENPADIEEERRLAFVGMTRAKNELTLSCARRRMIHGRTCSQTASRFIDEIGGDGVTIIDATTRRSQNRARRSGFFADNAVYSDVEARAIIEAQMDAMEAPPEYEHLRAGCVIMHPTLGRGKVVRLRRRWPDTRAEIIFDDMGPKTIVLARTSVEIIEER